MWAIGRYDLGLSEEAFWCLTPAQFYALLERNRAEFEHSLFGSALICSTLANIYRDPKKQRNPFSPADFLPSRKVNHVQTVEEQLKVVLAINTALGGSDERW